MEIQFWGATQTVTGSRFLVTGGSTRILVDCGLFQGYKWLRERNWQPLPFAVDKLDAVVLTHAHLDHSGFLPGLYRAGYRGPIYCHDATRALCEILLADSGRIQEEDAAYHARHKLGKHRHPLPLYTERDALQTCELFESRPFHKPFTVGDFNISLSPAGHILGASCVILEQGGRRVGFSGDVGRPDDCIMLPPQPLPALDALILESTYGNRRHDKRSASDELAEVVNRTVKRGGIVVVPTFAVGRAQALQHLLGQLQDSGEIPDVPIYLDSPMAIDVSDIYCLYQRLHRLNVEACRNWRERTTYTPSVDESKALEHQHYPHIILAGSGMATGGRVLHHMKRLLPDHRNTLLFTGFQSGGTRGARLLGGAEDVKIHGQYVPVNAEVTYLDGLSAHADYYELARWLESSQLAQDTPIYLVHGESEAQDSFRCYLQRNTRHPVEVAEMGEMIDV